MRAAAYGALLVGACTAERAAVERVEEVRDSACAGAAANATRCREQTEQLLAKAAPDRTRRASERNALARTLVVRATAEAAKLGPATNEELQASAEREWPRFNTGPIVSVIHALFPASPNAAERAEAFAVRIAQTSDPKSFEQLAHEAGRDVVVERIDHIGNQGRTVEGLTLERAFADAAVALTKDSPRSHVVHTPYGEHMLMATEWLTARIATPAEAQKGVGEAAVAERVRKTLDGARLARPSAITSDAKETLQNAVSQP